MLLVTRYSLLVLLFAFNHSLFTAAHAATLSPYEVEKLSGRKAPDFTLRDINGNPVAISSFKGKVVLLNFWATWCPPCRDEIVSLDRLNLRLRSKGFAVVAVSIDRSLSTVKDFIRSNPVSFTVLIDEKLEVAKSQYKVFTVPMTFLINKNGIIVEKYFGERNWTKPQIVKKIEALL